MGEEKELSDEEKHVKRYKIFYIGMIMFYGLFLLGCGLENNIAMMLGTFVFFGIISIVERVIVLHNEILKRLP